MNIFILDRDPQRAAEMVFDTHSIGMCKENMQILCTNLRIMGFDHESMCASTHPQHPSTIWSRTSAHNMAWHVCYAGALFKEYTKRYKKHHQYEAMYTQLMSLFDKAMDTLESQGKIDMTDFALAMPDECKLACPVASYHKYYAHKAQQEIDKLLVYKQEMATYNTLQGKVWSFLSGRKKPRKPALRFVWQRGNRPTWATFPTAQHEK